MRERIEQEIKPIYQELLSNIKTDKSFCTFCAQWGKNFFKEENNRILFIGKAVNGWITDSKEINVLFGKGESRIFDRSDQMEWVDNLDGKKNGYNTRKSTFWRVIRKTSQMLLNKNDVISRIAWSNIYKISPDSGNPNGRLQKMQKDYCKKLLKKEIELFNPKYVVFLTSHWETEFVEYLNNGSKPKLIETKIWGKNHESSSFIIDNTIYIISQHPQGKKEYEHSKAIVDLILNAEKASA